MAAERDAIVMDAIAGIDVPCLAIKEEDIVKESEKSAGCKELESFAAA